MTDRVRIEKASKVFKRGVKALNNVSFRVPPVNNSSRRLAICFGVCFLARRCPHVQPSYLQGSNPGNRRHIAGRYS